MYVVGYQIAVFSKKLERKKYYLGPLDGAQYEDVTVYFSCIYVSFHIKQAGINNIKYTVYI